MEIVPTVDRLLKNPILKPNMDDVMGNNLCGPSLIRVPSWIKNPLGRYYIYFANHMGRYIRLAYADHLRGPWRTYRPGALSVEQSLFVDVSPPEQSLEDRPVWADEQKAGYLYAHVASPDVHIDNIRKQIRMYYHGLLDNGDQQTRVAYSDNGIEFHAKKHLLGPSYFRVFEFKETIYALSWGGAVHCSQSWDKPFETRDEPILVPAMDNHKLTIRHLCVFLLDQTLHVFYSCIGDKPESLYHCPVLLHPDWKDWQAGPISKILQPVLDWEGVGKQEVVSEIGPSMGYAPDLRDPYVFKDNGEIYLLYCGGAEYGGIGIASVSFNAP